MDVYRLFACCLDDKTPLYMITHTRHEWQRSSNSAHLKIIFHLHKAGSNELVSRQVKTPFLRRSYTNKQLGNAYATS